MKKVFLTLALVAGLSFFAAAQSTGKVSKNQVTQAAKIKHGVIRGELTKREARKLKNQQQHIRMDKRIAKADGVVTKAERAHIRHEQRVANRSIYRQKHDAQSRN